MVVMFVSVVEPVLVATLPLDLPLVPIAHTIFMELLCSVKAAQVDISSTTQFAQSVLWAV